MLLTTTQLQDDNAPAIPLRISDYKISVEVKNQFSRTEIVQVLKNPQDVEISDIYCTFPLTDDAMIQSSAFSINGKCIRSGKILSAAEAYHVYMESAQNKENTPILRYIGTRAYSVRVGHIPANGEIEIRFGYSQMLSIGSVFARYTYPLSLTKATQTHIENFEVNINIKSDFDIQRIYLPSDGIVVNDRWWVNHKAQNFKPDRDFAFEYTVSDPRFGIGLIAHRTRADLVGFFKLFIAPRYENQIPDISPKKFIFVLDRSERMAGEKLRRAKEVLRKSIYNLNFRDEFNIIACNGTLASLNTNGTLASLDTNYRRRGLWQQECDLDPNDGRGGLFVPVDFFDVRHERKRALTFVENIEPSGETNINDALLTALNGNHERIIVLVTDGSTGAMNAPRILENIAEANADQARIFVIGVGDGSNVHFLEKLAAANGGTYHHLEPNEDIEVAVSSLFKKINDPVLTQIKIDFGDIAVEDVYPDPQGLPELFSHEQLTLVGRYRGHGYTNLKLSGFINGEEHEFTKEIQFPKFESRFDFLPHLWAQVKVKALKDQVRQRESNDERIKEIKQLSKAYGILTPYAADDIPAGLPSQRLHANTLKSP